MKYATIALVALAGSAVPAAAQDPILALNPTTMIGYAGTTAANAYVRKKGGARSAARPPARRAGPAISVAQVVAKTSYRPDPAVRRETYARALATIQKVSPEDAAQLKPLLANGKILTAASVYLHRYGMAPTNVVDTTTLYLAAAWFASRASDGDPTPAQMKGLRSQVARTFATMPQVLGASDAAKQDLAEANIIQAMLAGALANQAARNPKVAGTVRASVIRGVRESYQLDLSHMNLTATGLR